MSLSSGLPKAGPRGCGKKIKGRKRNIVTNTHSNLVGIVVLGADVQSLPSDIYPRGP